MTDWIEGTFGLDAVTQAKVFRSIVAIVLLVIINRAAVRVILARTTDIRTGYHVRKIAAYFTFAIAFIIVGRIWFGGIDSLATFTGLIAAGLVVALRDPILNVAGWMFIIWRRPFEFGDRIQIGDHFGDVVDLRVFQFTLVELRGWVDADQPTGRLLHVPNSHVFSKAQANYSKGIPLIWDELRLYVTFESNWKAAKSLLQGVAQRHSETVETMSARDSSRRLSSQLLQEHAELTPQVHTSIDDRGVQLTLRYLCDPSRRRATATAIGEDVLREILAQPDIRIAYPTIRYYDGRSQEGSAEQPR